MKAEMDRNGTITVVPETGAEAHALKHWAQQFIVPCEMKERMLDRLIHPSGIRIEFIVPTPIDTAQE